MLTRKNKLTWGLKQSRKNSLAPITGRVKFFSILHKPRRITVSWPYTSQNNNSELCTPQNLKFGPYLPHSMLLVGALYTPHNKIPRGSTSNNKNPHGKNRFDYHSDKYTYIQVLGVSLRKYVQNVHNVQISPPSFIPLSMQVTCVQ
jgi:hypothetical protein